MGFQLSSLTESNLPSEPLSMNKHSKVFCFLSDQHATIPALISSLSSHSGLPCHLHVHHSRSALLPHCTGAEVHSSAPSTGLYLPFILLQCSLTEFPSQGNSCQLHYTIYPFLVNQNDQVRWYTPAIVALNTADRSTRRRPASVTQ